MEEASFWMVWVDGTKTPTCKHETLQGAYNEAERIARLPDNAGKRVYLMQAIQVCTYNAVQWQSLHDKNIPQF
jgi:hypothetical protein